MNDDLESALRRALKPVSPKTDFAERVLARLAESPAARPAGRARAWWLSAGLAASLLIGLTLQHQRQEARGRQAGLEAKRQVIEALHLTEQKLDLAYRVVKDQSSDGRDTDTGA